MNVVQNHVFKQYDRHTSDDFFEDFSEIFWLIEIYSLYLGQVAMVSR